MRPSRSHLPVLAAILVLAVPAAAEERGSLRVEIRGGDGEDLTVSVHGGVLGEILASVAKEALEDATVEADLDEDVEAMLRHLDRGGDGARYTLQGDDGDEVRARRRGTRLELDIRGEDGERSRIEVPWAMAEWMLGRRPSRDAAPGDFEIRVEGEDGSVRVEVD